MCVCTDLCRTLPFAVVGRRFLLCSSSTSQLSQFGPDFFQPILPALVLGPCCNGLRVPLLPVQGMSLCGASHNANNAESAVMRTPHHGMLGWRHGMAPLLRIIVGAFSKAMSLSVALKRPVRSFGAIAASRVSSFTVGSARV